MVQKTPCRHCTAFSLRIRPRFFAHILCFFRRPWFSRHSFDGENERKQKIVGSIYVGSDFELLSGLPCVIYLHGPASSQLEGQFLIPNICPYGIAVYLFDFAGCGRSGGSTILRGYFDPKDLNFLISDLSRKFNVTKFILWGRSMGASAALLCRNPMVVGIVVDSTYSSLRSLCKSIAVPSAVPRILCPFFLWLRKLCVSDIAGFELSEVSPKTAAKMEGNPPMIMGHAPDDTEVRCSSGKKLFNCYSCGDKTFMELEGGHNGVRSVNWLRQCYNFIFEKFGIDGAEFRLAHLIGFELTALFRSIPPRMEDSSDDLDGGSLTGSQVFDEALDSASKISVILTVS
jgi:hypothetical protein